MALNLAQRMHVWISNLGRPTEYDELVSLYREAEALFQSHGLMDDCALEDLMGGLAFNVFENFDLDIDHPQFVNVVEFLSEVIEVESLFHLPDIYSPKPASVTEIWQLREDIIRQRSLVHVFDQTCEALVLFTSVVFNEMWQAVPSLLADAETDGIKVKSQLVQQVGNAGGVIHKLADFAFSEEFKSLGIFSTLRSILEYNLIAASGGNPTAPGSFTRTPKYAHKSDIKDVKELVRTYLQATPLFGLFDQEVVVTIPTKTRFEHHHILAGSGHGKTQTLQYLIANDLSAVSRGKRSVVVLDSQGDLIRNISSLAVFAPGGPLHDRIVIIDPTDVEYPVSLNLFDVGQERLADYDLLERERLTNSILELYDYVLGTLLDAQMTQKQSVIFRYVTRLMLHIPNATIHTLRELMEPGSEVTFAEHIAKLSGTPRHFFETEFSGREFEQTKKQVLRRLWGVLENQTFERMFSHPRSKLDLFGEMNAGKVILINTAKDLLKESGTEIFGRFFIALIAQAAQERATLHKSQRMPTMVYIDEAADYFDRNIGIILSQARKYGVGMVLAHQYLGQLSAGLQEAFAANTSIKFAGGVSAKDARFMASSLYCDPSLIEAQPKGSYASYIKGTTKKAVPLEFPFGVMEDMPQMNQQERIILQEQMREHYAIHYTELEGQEVATVETEEEEQTEDTPEDPNEPTPYW